MKRVIAAALLTFSFSAQGAEYIAPLSPTGYWRTIDDSTGKAKGIVFLETKGDLLEGRIIADFEATDGKAEKVCSKCTGERKNKPVIGMVFLWGMKAAGESWRDGEILDPETGDIYDAKLKVIDGGKKLEVRGFLGISLFGRSQIWERTTAPNN